MCSSDFCYILTSAFNGQRLCTCPRAMGWLIGICSSLCSSPLTLCTILDQTKWSRLPCTFCRSQFQALRSMRMRHQQSLPLTRGHGACSSAFTHLPSQTKVYTCRYILHFVLHKPWPLWSLVLCPFLLNRTKLMALGSENTVVWFFKNSFHSRPTKTYQLCSIWTRLWPGQGWLGSSACWNSSPAPPAGQRDRPLKWMMSEYYSIQSCCCDSHVCYHCVTRKMASYGCKEVCSIPRQGLWVSPKWIFQEDNVVGLHSEVPKVLASQLGYLQGEGARVGGEGIRRCESLPLQTGHWPHISKASCCMGRICLSPSCGSLDLGTNYEWKTNFLFNSEPEEAAPEPPHHVLWTAPLKTAKQYLQPLARLCFRLSCPDSLLTLLKDSVVFSHPEY